jgi:hypothetical protein
VGIEILVLLAILTPFVLVLFWLVRPIGKLPVVKDMTLDKLNPKLPDPPPAGVNLFAFVFNFLLGLFVGSSSLESAFPAMFGKSTAPNYPESIILGFIAIICLSHAIVGIAQGIVGIGQNSLDRLSRAIFSRPFAIVGVVIVALIAVADAFPAWFGLKHEPKFIVPVVISIFLALMLFGAQKGRRIQRMLQDADAAEPVGQSSLHELSAHARVLADAGEKLEAVKLHTEETGIGLMEAKSVVEAYLSADTITIKHGPGTRIFSTAMSLMCVGGILTTMPENYSTQSLGSWLLALLPFVFGPGCLMIMAWSTLAFDKKMVRSHIPLFYRGSIKWEDVTSYQIGGPNALLSNGSVALMVPWLLPQMTLLWKECEKRGIPGTTTASRNSEN